MIMRVGVLMTVVMRVRVPMFMTVVMRVRVTVVMTVVMGVLVTVVMTVFVSRLGRALTPFRRIRCAHAGAPCGARNMRTTAMAAPKPLSMLTTVIPAAQLVSMPKSAVKPASATP